MMAHFLVKLNSNTLKSALVVGSFVFAINHGSAFIKGEMNPHRWFSASLGYAIPLLTGIYCPCAKPPSSDITTKATLEA